MKLLDRMLGRGKTAKKESTALPDGIDAETLAIAKELAFDKKMSRMSNGKGRRSKNGGAGNDEEEFPGLNEPLQDVVNRLFERTVEDTVLANRFVNKEGRSISGLTVRKATAMDGLRDFEPVNGDVGTDTHLSSPMNPEGRYHQPTSLPRVTPGFGDVGRRINEAINPKGYAVMNAIPEEILKHFAEFATFIGYPLCEVIAAHPTVSNACAIPAKDAIAPGYKLKFLDSEDIDGDGIPDEEEDEGLQKVTSQLQKEKALLSLHDALREIGRPTDGKTVIADKGALMRELTLSIERLAAYEMLAKDEGNPVQTSNLIPLMTALHSLANEAEETTVKSRDAAYEATRDALVSLGDEKVRTLEATKKEIAKRKAVRAVNAAVQSISIRHENQLNDLAVAVERLAAYDEVSARNHELVAELGAAFTSFAKDQETETERNRAFQALLKAVATLDSDDFDFEEEPVLDGVGKNADAAQQQAVGDPGMMEMPGAQDPNGEGDPNQATAQQMPQGMAAMMGGGGMPGMGGGEDPKAKEEEERKEKAKKRAEESKRRQKMLDQWKQRADDMGINAVCRRLAYNARVFGIGIAVPLVDHARYDQPFDISKIGKGSYHGFTIVEPTWIYPEVEGDDLINPLSKFFFEPMYWALNTTHGNKHFSIERIHRSWMVIVRHKEVPDMLRPMYYYGGIPLCQEIYEAVFCADKLMNEAPKLAMCKRTTVVKGDPIDFIANPEGMVDRLRARTQVQDNFGILYVGRNADVQQLETSLSEFDQIIAKANQRVASIAQMPETKLFKTQLAGMNSAGRYEWDDYAQLLVDIQSNWYTPLLQLHYKLDSMSQNGTPIAIKIEWNKIEIQTEQEQDQVASGRQQRVNNAIQAGYLSADEGRTIMRTHDELFSALSAENPVEQQDPNQQGGGMGGMPPGMGGGMPPGMPGMPDMGGGAGGDGGHGGGVKGGNPPKPGGGAHGGVPVGSPLKEPKAAKERK